MNTITGNCINDHFDKVNRISQNRAMFSHLERGGFERYFAALGLVLRVALPKAFSADAKWSTQTMIGVLLICSI